MEILNKSNQIHRVETALFCFFFLQSSCFKYLKVCLTHVANLSLAHIGIWWDIFTAWTCDNMPFHGFELGCEIVQWKSEVIPYSVILHELYILVIYFIYTEEFISNPWPCCFPLVSGTFLNDIGLLLNAQIRNALNARYV